MEAGRALLVFFCVAVVLFGCISPAPPQPTPTPAPQSTPSPAPASTPTPTPAPTATPTPVPAVPFGFLYFVGMPSGGGPGSPQVSVQEINLTYWFEEQGQCNGRPAFLGLGKAAYPVQGDSYFKGTVYLDNGESAASGQMSRAELAFDTAKAQPGGDFDPAFLLNNIFAAGGRNFLNDSVWNSSTPVILRNITLFGSPGDVAVAKKGLNSTAVPQCTIFTFSTRNAPTTFEVCVARVERSNVAYTVYFKPDDPAYADMMPTWRLVQVLSAPSGLMRTLQCMEPVHCPTVEMPSGDTRVACEADGLHTMSASKDEKGCTVRYECISAVRARFIIDVVDPSGRPVQNLEVDLWPGESEPQGPPAMGANTDAQGRVSFNVTQGSWWMGYNMNNYPRQYTFMNPAQYRIDRGEFQITVNMRNA